MAVCLFVVGMLLFISLSLLFWIRLLRVSPRWAIATLLIPPIIPVSFSSYIRTYRVAGSAQLASGFLVLVATVMLVRTFPDQKPFSEMPRLRAWLAPASMGLPEITSAFPLFAGRRHGERLLGQLKGEKIAWSHIQLINKTLQFANEDKTLPAALIQIHLENLVLSDDMNLHLLLTPNAEDSPRIEIFSRPGSGVGVPELAVFNTGYWLELDLTKDEKNLFHGYVKLLLPQETQTWLTGEFVGYTDGVRYSGREIDRRHDSLDTLKRIAASHVHSHLWKWLEGTPQIKNVSFQTNIEPFTGQATVLINLGASGIRELPVEYFKGESGWVLEPKAIPLLAANLEMQHLPAASGGTTKQTEKPVFKDVQFSQLHRFLDHRATIFTFDGRQLSGKLLKVGTQQVKLRRSLSGADFDMTIPGANIARAAVLH